MTKFMQKTQWLVDRISGFLGYLSGAAFLVLSFYISWEALARKFGLPYSGVSDEISGYTLAVAGAWGMAHVLRLGEHVRIDVVSTHLPKAVQHILNILAFALVSLFTCLLAIYAWRLGLQSAAIGARGMSLLRAPLAVPQFMVAIGFTVLALQAVVMLINSILVPDIYEIQSTEDGAAEIRQQI